MEKMLKKYYSEISRQLICDRKQKSIFMKELKENVDEYISLSPECTMGDIYSAFGTPDSIARSFAESEDYTKIKNKLNIKRFILFAIALALLIYLAFIVISLIDVHTEAHGYFEEGIMMINVIKDGVRV